MILYLLIGLLCFALAIALWLNRSLRVRLAVQREWLHQHRRLARLGRRDALTALPNRSHLERLLPRLLARASRGGTRLALLLLALDRLGDVNDSLGHRRGDELLVTMARRLRASLADHDVVVRMSGDEFLVVATLLPKAEVVNAIVTRIRSVLQAPLDLGGATVSMSTSIGISIYPEDGTDPEQLLRYADIALSHAKEPGPGNHRFYAREMSIALPEAGPRSSSKTPASWTAGAARGSTSARR